MEMMRHERLNLKIRLKCQQLFLNMSKMSDATANEVYVKYKGAQTAIAYIFIVGR